MWLWPIEWGSICCSSVRSLTPSPTQSFQIKLEVYFSKRLCHSSLLLCRCYDFACICVCIVGHGCDYTTQNVVNITIKTKTKVGKLMIQSYSKKRFKVS